MILDCKVGLLAAASAFCGLALAPSVANACSCFGQTLVGQQDMLAVNADLLLGDSCGGAEPPTVTVDGLPAKLAGDAPSSAYLRRIEPAVVEGQTVVLNFANDFDEQPSVSLVVGPADTTPPTVGAVKLAVEDWNDFDDFCGGGDPVAGRVVVNVAAPVEDNDTRYFFTVYLDGEMQTERVVARFYGQDVVSISQSFDEEPAEICVDIHAVDAAGNASEVSSDCVEGPAGDDDGAGCSCTTGDDQSGWLALPFFALLFGVRRRLG